MVSISRRRVKASRPFHLRSRSGNHTPYDSKSMGLLAAGALCVLYMLWQWGHHHNRPVLNLVRTALQRRKELQEHPQLHVSNDLNDERFNALALDILRTLDCVHLFNETADLLNQEAAAEQRPYENNEHKAAGTDSTRSRSRRRRRLEEGKFTADTVENDMIGWDDGEEFGGGPGGRMDDLSSRDATAHHLFCVAAFSPLLVDEVEPDPGAAYWKGRMDCDATNPRYQRALLQLWSAARAEFETKEFLITVLDMAVEQSRTLLEQQMHLWMPIRDEGTEYTMTMLNEKATADHGGIYGLSHSLGVGKTFVDVGSALGVTSLAVALLYPGTRIISIEAAPPNWLMQELNWICLDEVMIAPDHPPVQRLLAGVGPVTGGPQFAPMLWQKDSTSRTRSWTLESERKPDDVELKIKLQTWHSILYEMGLNPADHEIDVLNVDCEGCEYNLIPDLSDDEYDSISTVMGQVHWGYIPHSKLPSSKRAEITHRRLCTHENMARSAKECCAFLDLPVLSSSPGEVLLRQKEGEEDEGAAPFNPFAQKATVEDIAGEFCHDFETWAADKRLFTIESDWGWFQLTPVADDA